MREVFGKRVYDQFTEVVDSTHTALIVIDMQNDFAHPDGNHAAHGRDTTRIHDIVPAIDELVAGAREAGVLVIWIMNTCLPEGRSDSPAWLAFKSHVGSGAEYTIDGSWGHGLVAPLEPRVGEPVVQKFRSSAFVGTPLDLLLRSNGIETVVLCGCVTEGCVESTARSASFHEYHTYLAGDCVASTRPDLHDAALLVLGARYPIRARTDYLTAWRHDDRP